MYRDDPRWITARYPGKDRNGATVRPGDRVLYYPRTRTMLRGEAAEQAWRDFQAAAWDEAQYATLGG